VKPWSLVSYRTRGGEERAGALFAEHVVELSVAACGVLELIERWVEVEPALRAFDPASALRVDGARLELPLR